MITIYEGSKGRPHVPCRGLYKIRVIFCTIATPSGQGNYGQHSAEYSAGVGLNKIRFCIIRSAPLSLLGAPLLQSAPSLRPTSSAVLGARKSTQFRCADARSNTSKKIRRNEFFLQCKKIYNSQQTPICRIATRRGSDVKASGRDKHPIGCFMLTELVLSLDKATRNTLALRRSSQKND